MSHSIPGLGCRLGIACIFFAIGCQNTPSRTVTTQSAGQQAIIEAVSLSERLKKIETSLITITDEVNLAKSSNQCYDGCQERAKQFDKFYGTTEWATDTKWPKSAKEEIEACRDKCRPLQSVFGGC